MVSGAVRSSGHGAVPAQGNDCFVSRTNNTRASERSTHRRLGGYVCRNRRRVDRRQHTLARSGLGDQRRRCLSHAAVRPPKHRLVTNYEADGRAQLPSNIGCKTVFQPHDAISYLRADLRATHGPSGCDERVTGVGGASSQLVAWTRWAACVLRISNPSRPPERSFEGVPIRRRSGWLVVALRRWLRQPSPHRSRRTPTGSTTLMVRERDVATPRHFARKDVEVLIAGLDSMRVTSDGSIRGL